MAIICEWFAMCDHETTEGASHPILGVVPICARCAERMEIVPEFELTEVSR